MIVCLYGCQWQCRWLCCRRLQQWALHFHWSIRYSKFYPVTVPWPLLHSIHRWHTGNSSSKVITALCLCVFMFWAPKPKEMFRLFFGFCLKSQPTDTLQLHRMQYIIISKILRLTTQIRLKHRLNYSLYLTKWNAFFHVDYNSWSFRMAWNGKFVPVQWILRVAQIRQNTKHTHYTHTPWEHQTKYNHFFIWTRKLNLQQLQILSNFILLSKCWTAVLWWRYM